MFKLGAGAAPKVEVFRDGFFGVHGGSFVMPNDPVPLFSESLIRAAGALLWRNRRRGSVAPILLAIFDREFCVLL
jgi:hypothetical protein